MKFHVTIHRNYQKLCQDLVKDVKGPKAQQLQMASDGFRWLQMASDGRHKLSAGLWKSSRKCRRISVGIMYPRCKYAIFESVAKISREKMPRKHDKLNKFEQI